MESTASSSESGSRIGVVTGLTFRGREYDITEIDSEVRDQFAQDLSERIEELDGIDEVFLAGWDGGGNKESARLEITLTTVERSWGETVAANLRSLSPRLRQTLADPAYVSSSEVVDTPTAVNADAGVYEQAFFIAEVWFR
jgi:hypothetical protein